MQENSFVMLGFVMVMGIMVRYMVLCVIDIKSELQGKVKICIHGGMVRTSVGLRVMGMRFGMPVFGTHNMIVCVVVWDFVCKDYIYPG